MDSPKSDQLNTRLLLMIAILGAVLAIIGWFRYVGAN
jgi:hypothetical protein